MKEFNAQTIIDGFESLFDFPLEQRHSGHVYTSYDLADLQENDSAFGEYWANYLDSICIQADFDLQDLQRCGDSVLSDYWFTHMINNHTNGNLKDCKNDLVELWENDQDELLEMLSNLDNKMEVKILRLLLGSL